MKGFAKIFEAIIASIIVLASLTFFFVPATGVSRWDSTSLQVTADDVLQAVYLNGSLERFVKTDNRTQLNSEVSGMLPKNVDFSIEVSGIPNDIIYVSCVDCPSSDELVAMLSPLNFQYKNRNISMRIDPLTLSSTSIPSETNILFFLDKQGIIDYHAKIDVFLNNGGSIFLLSDLTQSDVQGVIGNIFNLSWTGNTAQSAHFEDVFNPNKTSHYAARYYANLTNRTLESTASVNFPVDASGFHQNGVLANSDEKNIVVTNDQRAYARSNFTALNNKGRSVWFADYNRADHNAPTTKAIDSLVKAAIMWDSGERFKLDVIKKEPAPIHVKTGIFVFGEDPYLVELTVWNVFF